MPDVQTKRLFYDYTPDRRYPELAEHFDLDDPAGRKAARLWACDFVESPACPLSRVIYGEENAGPVELLKTLAITALRDPFRTVRGTSFGLFANPGQGKTFVAKAFAETLGLPTLFVQSDTLDDPERLAELLFALFGEIGLPLVKGVDVTLPPCVVIFDEAHALPKDMRTGGLLNATEANDGVLRVPLGKNHDLNPDHAPEIRIDCREVLWIYATTDPGILQRTSEALFSRIPYQLTLQDARPDTRARMVDADNARRHAADPARIPRLPYHACEDAAKYGKSPRTAVAFAGQMTLHRNAHAGSWEEAADAVRTALGYHENGVLQVVLNALETLKSRSLSNENLIAAVGVRKEQFDGAIRAELLTGPTGYGPLAGVSGRGWGLTDSGRRLLADLAA